MQVSKIDFMRKSRFEKIKSLFNGVSTEAQKIIDGAQSNDILRLCLSVNSPIAVVEAEIFTEEKFAQLAFN